MTHVAKHLKVILEVLLEKAPKGYNISEIISNLSQEEHVRNIHHVHLWSIEGNVPIITFHARISHKVDTVEAAKTTQRLKDRLKEIGIVHSTIQIEFFDNQCEDPSCEEIDIEESNGGHHHHHH